MGRVLRVASMNQRHLEVTSSSIVGDHEGKVPRPLTHPHHSPFTRHTTVSILDHGLGQGQPHVNLLSSCQAPGGGMELMDSAWAVLWGGAHPAQMSCPLSPCLPAYLTSTLPSTAGQKVPGCRHEAKSEPKGPSRNHSSRPVLWAFF